MCPPPTKKYKIMIKQTTGVSIVIVFALPFSCIFISKYLQLYIYCNMVNLRKKQILVKIPNLQYSEESRLVMVDLHVRKDTSFANNPTALAPYPPVMSQQ